jgi:hypothetical protein
MVLEYLHSAAFFHDSPPHRDASQQDAARLKRRGSRSSPRQSSLLAPVARLLKDSAGAVNNAALHLRDGLTEEQRTALRKVEERKQILHAKLKNVGSVLRPVTWGMAC